MNSATRIQMKTSDVLSERNGQFLIQADGNAQQYNHRAYKVVIYI